MGEIWDWNAKRDGKEHADGYVAFLKSETEKLRFEIDPGQPVSLSKSLRYALIRRQRKGYGHIAVFTIDGDTFRVVRYFHTSQDWQNSVAALKFD